MNETKNWVTHSDKAADRGEPSYVWRAGQQRRMKMILTAAGERARGVILENGCGVGMYLSRLAPDAVFAVGLEVEHERGAEALALCQSKSPQGAVVNEIGRAHV